MNCCIFVEGRGKCMHTNYLEQQIEGVTVAKVQIIGTSRDDRDAFAIREA